MSVKPVAAALTAAALTMASTAASALTLASIDNGWIDGTGYAGSSNTNIFTSADGDGFRSYYAFDLSGVTETVTGATLSFAFGSSEGLTGTGRYESPDPSETVNFHAVTTDLTALYAGTAGVAGYADLGDGALYGSATVFAKDMDPMPAVSVALTPAALTDVNAARGGGFAIGGTLAVAGGTIEGAIWSSSANGQTGLASLELSFGAPASPVPAPAAAPLLAAGLGALAFARRRRR
ncbi:VPLPA-CTERM protein sorting domain-containing protein [Albimonas donghaensis]|uniref:VPLPA-CTERM protein sorting domain-containing protein n=1 Tax=Albimonas donghaensis TaxID=356660 RepID=A0A1H2YJL8_9RHOB|nr:PEP-CTERM sorting domain-containing protein [Albimonas donghaensis]SDX05413.1 VPLPA-CTERM protein sorting domain-containing protein [Albimonas donghaensis]